MARRKARKMQPAVETLTFELGTTGIATTSPGWTPGQETYFFDTSQICSLANRRFYRQGLNWAISGFRLISTNVVRNTEQPVTEAPSGSVTVQKLPQTWIMSNAWEKSFRAWQRMNKEALAENPSVKPKFLDFKIYMDSKHHELGYARNQLPVVLDGTPVGGYTEATEGEWEPSKIHYPIAVGTTEGAMRECELIAVGQLFPGAGASGVDAVSLIEGYAASRGLPNILDPNTPLDAADADNVTPENWLAAMFNEGTGQTEDVISDMVSENNIAPYPFENDGIHNDTMYPGGANQLNGLQLHTVEAVTGTTVGGVTYLKGGNFPCGLIRIDTFNNDQTYEMYNVLQIDLVPGTHRGYLAESMTEM